MIEERHFSQESVKQLLDGYYTTIHEEHPGLATNLLARFNEANVDLEEARECRRGRLAKHDGSWWARLFDDRYRLKRALDMQVEMRKKMRDGVAIRLAEASYEVRLAKTIRDAETVRY